MTTPVTKAGRRALTKDAMVNSNGIPQILGQLEFYRNTNKLTSTQLAAELGITYPYWCALRSSPDRIQTIGEELVRRIAELLGFPVVVVRLLCNQLALDDFEFTKSYSEKEICAAIRYMRADRRWAHYIPEDVLSESPSVQLFILALYQAATGRVLLELTDELFERIAHKAKVRTNLSTGKTQPGPILGLLFDHAELMSLTIGELTAQLDISSRYLNDLRSGHKSTSDIGPTFLHQMGKILGLSFVDAQIAAGQITLADFYARPKLINDLLPNALQFISADPVWQNKWPPEITKSTIATKMLVVLLYEDTRDDVVIPTRFTTDQIVRFYEEISSEQMESPSNT